MAKQQIDSLILTNEELTQLQTDQTAIQEAIDLDKKIVRNHQNYDHITMSDGLTTTQVSETIPNQTLTMSEMIERYVTHREVPGLKNFDFDDPTTLNLPELAKMDKLERLQYLQDVNETIESETLELKDIQTKIALNKLRIKKTKEAPKLDPGPEE